MPSSPFALLELSTSNFFFNFEFSAVYLRTRVISKLSKGSNWVSVIFTVEIEAK